jgi:hypothetical protein
MTMVIVIGLYRSMKQVLWKNFPQFFQNIVSYRTQQSANLHREMTFTQSEPLVQLSHLREKLAPRTFSI